MTIETDILTALFTKLTTPALNSPATPIAWPMVIYTPVAGTPYFDVRPILRAAPEHLQLATSGPALHRGILQVDAVVPDTQGESPGLRLADLVAARFPIGTTLTAGSRLLRILRTPSIAAAVKDAPWVRYPVSIPYLVIS